MKRTRLLLLLTTLACAQPGQDEQEANERPPIGPGSDSTALIPPDTPESRINPPGPAGDSLRDTVR